MKGRTICALSDAAALPAISFITKFREEFEAYIRGRLFQRKGELYA